MSTNMPPELRGWSFRQAQRRSSDGEHLGSAGRGGQYLVAKSCVVSDLDLLVIGGGVLGTTTAALARLDHPEWKVRVVERGRVGQGVTGASDGLSFPVARNAWQTSLVESSARGYARLQAEFPELPMHDVDVLWVVGADRVLELTRCLVGGAPVTPSDTQLSALRAAYPNFTIKPDEVVLTTTQRCFYSVRDVMSFHNAWDLFDDANHLNDGGEAAAAAKLLLSQLDWWASLLRQGRSDCPYPA